MLSIERENDGLHGPWVEMGDKLLETVLND